MMDLALFQEITTEEALQAIEAEAKTYQGLYVDMNNAPERKYVKEKASDIASLLKRLDRARIDKAKSYKIEVESQAQAIKDRLEEANRPFTSLIDEYAEARKKVLAEKKAIEDAKELVMQIERDHEEAITINKVFAFEKAERERLQKQRDDAIRQEAAEQAKAQAEHDAEQRLQRIERDRLQKEAEEKAEIERRERDVSHKREVNRKIVSALAKHDVDETLAKFIVTAIAKGEIPNLKINY